MKNYELSYLIIPELKIEEAESVALDVKDFIQNQGGLISRSEGPNPKTLGYKIKGRMSALQVNLEFSLEPDKLKMVEEKIKKNPNILRHLATNKKLVKEEPKRKRMARAFSQQEPTLTKTAEEKKTPEDHEKKVELKDIDEKLEEILKE